MNSILRLIFDVLDLPGKPVAGGSSRFERGSGNMTSEERDVRGFNEVEMRMVGNLIITQGGEEHLVIEAEDNILPYIETTVTGGRLLITHEHHFFDWMRPTLPITFHLSVKDLSQVKLSGSGGVQCDSLKSDRFRIEISGSGKASFGELTASSLEIGISGSGDGRFQHVTAEEIETRISGSGDLTIAGRTTRQEIRIGGAGTYEAGELTSDVTRLDISGSGDARVRVASQLQVGISGSGSIRYYGSPSVSQRISGSGRIRRVEP